MPYFVLYALDRENVDAKRAEVRDAHRTWLREGGGMPLKVHVGGPMLDDNGRMIGTTLVMEASDKQTVERFVEGDPYTTANLFSQINIHPFHWGLNPPKAALHKQAQVT